MTVTCVAAGRGRGGVGSSRSGRRQPIVGIMAALGRRKHEMGTLAAAEARVAGARSSSLVGSGGEEAGGRAPDERSTRSGVSGCLGDGDGASAGRWRGQSGQGRKKP
jgi:hypothetical protein